MSRGPDIHEIFSSQAMGKTDNFKFDNKESKQQLKLSKKGDARDQSQMKKFGGYKPKILEGEVDFIEIQETSKSEPDSPKVGLRSQPEQIRTGITSALKSQPLNPKPWVIGDKNVPMVLGTTIDNEEDDDDNNNSLVPQAEDSGVYNSDNYSDKDNGQYNSNDLGGLSRTFSVSSETSTLVSHTSEDSKQGIDNPVVFGNSFTSINDVTSSVSETDKTNLGNYKINGVRVENLEKNEPIGVFIPAPDYDEDEKTLEFNSDDTDGPSDDGEEAQSRQVKPTTAVKVYEGADFSQYLSEDDLDLQEVVLRNDLKSKNNLGRKTKSEIHKSKPSDKQAVFKQSANKTKRKSSGSATTFNSVRSFSYADSKFGTKGKSFGKSFSASNLPDDSEMFLSANTQQSSYESFLKSRHSDDLPCVASDNGRSELDHSSKHEQKRDPMWKKLTLRLKHKMSKSTGT